MWRKAPGLWAKIKDFLGLPDLEALGPLAKASALTDAFKEWAAKGKKAVAQVFDHLRNSFPLNMFFVPQKRVPGITDLLQRMLEKVPWLKKALDHAGNALSRVDALLSKHLPTLSKPILAAAFIWIWFSVAELSWDIPFLVRGFTGHISLGELFGSLPESGLGLLASMFGLGYGALPVTLAIRVAWLVAQNYVSWIPGRGLQVHWNRLGVESRDEMVAVVLNKRGCHVEKSMAHKTHPNDKPEDLRTVPCPRCDSKGRRPDVWKPEEGRCFKCEGRKTITFSVPRYLAAREALRSKFVKARHQLKAAIAFEENDEVILSLQENLDDITRRGQGVATLLRLANALLDLGFLGEVDGVVPIMDLTVATVAEQHRTV